MKKILADVKWKQTEALIKKKWDKLTEGDLDAIKGDIQLLGAKVEERYGTDKDKLAKEVKDLLAKIDLF